MLIQFAFFSAYFLFSVPWSKIVNTIGYKTTMVVGLLTMACGSIPVRTRRNGCLVPAFLDRAPCSRRGNYWSPSVGQSLCDLLGKPETAASRLDLTQAFNSLGTTIAPKIGGLLILAAAPLALAQLQQLTRQSPAPVSRAASLLGQDAILRDRRCIAVVGRADRLFQAAKDRRRGLLSPERRGTIRSGNILNLLLGSAFGIFAYVGAEVSIGSFSSQLFWFATDRRTSLRRRRRDMFPSTGAAP